METTTLSSLLLRVRRAVALNFPSSVWIRAELSQVNERRGHRYLQLIEKGESDSPVAKVDAVVWSRTYSSVLKQRGNTAAEVLAAGQEICAFVQLDFHEVYGLKLELLDWDPSFTLGQLELKRRAIVEQLQAENLFSKNGNLALPPVIQRIAVVTSAAAAGYADFLDQLNANPYGYHFETTLFDVSVQGELVGSSVTAALTHISSNPASFDVIAILRGGGSKLDLAGFDNLEIGRAIATCSLPVLVGIGHEIDETIPDLVAHKSLKTPTALAEFILGQCATYEGLQIDLGRRIARYGSQHIQLSSKQLEISSTFLGYAAKNGIEKLFSSLADHEMAINHQCQFALKLASSELENLAIQLESLDPKAILSRGYAIISCEGKRVLRPTDVKPGHRIITHFEVGNLESIVQ